MRAGSLSTNQRSDIHPASRVDAASYLGESQDMSKFINCSTSVILGLLEPSIPFGKSIQGLHWIVPLCPLISARFPIQQVFNYDFQKL